MNSSNIYPQLLTIEASVTKKKEYIYQAAMMEPHTSAELSIDDIVSLCDDLIDTHGMTAGIQITKIDYSQSKVNNLFLRSFILLRYKTKRHCCQNHPKQYYRIPTATLQYSAGNKAKTNLCLFLFYNLTFYS